MTVFKAFLKILAHNKWIVLLYTGLLVIFGGFFIQDNSSVVDFENTKPDIVIIDKDGDTIATGLTDFLRENAEVKTYESSEKLDDALFYREVNSIIEIPAGFTTDFMAGETPQVLIRSTGDYNSSLAEILLEKYLHHAAIFLAAGMDAEEIIKGTRDALAQDVSVAVLDGSIGDKYAKANRYFSFATYSILACLVYIICLVMSSFKNENIRRRNLISSTSYKKLNRELFAANCLYAVCLWLVYLAIGFVLVGGGVMWSLNGALYSLNALVFTINATALAFLISNLVANREAISGIVNVVALGSAFLCGAFVPMQWLPDSVITLAHILPAYWYNANNELLTEITSYSLENLWPVLANMLVLIAFTVGFIILSNVISRKRTAHK